MIKVKFSILAGLIFAVTTFIYLAITAKMDIAIVLSIFIFVISPFIFYFKMFSKIDFKTKFEKIDKTLVIYSGRSSHYLDGITVGGTLYLLSDRLIFQTNALNFSKRHEQIIFLSQVAEVEFIDMMGFIKNSLLIKIKNNNSERFVISKRETWKEQIEKQVCILN